MADPIVIQQFLQANSWLDEFSGFKNHLLRHLHPTSDVFVEVNELIRGLNLAEYEDPAKNKVSHAKPGDAQHDRESFINRDSCDKPDGNDHSDSSKIRDGPKMVQAPSFDNHAMALMPSRRFSLSRQPETSISEVSISTKVTNMDENYRPIRGSKSTPRRFSFTYLSARAKNFSKGEFVPPSKLQEAPVALQGETRPTLRQKRSSLVGQTLPKYIQEQLKQLSVQVAESEGSDVLHSNPLGSKIAATSPDDLPQSDKSSSKEETKSNSIAAANTLAKLSPATTKERAEQEPEPDQKPKQIDTRIHNLLSNSASFHFHPDNSSPHVSQKDSGSPILETELEYISPSSFTKSIEYLDPSFLSSADGSVDGNEYEDNGAGSSSTQEDELFFPKIRKAPGSRNP